MGAINKEFESNMVRIRLRRMGLKKQPSYRIVVADQRSARDGGFIEIVGNHNPRTMPITEVVEEDRVLYWLSVGAQPSEAVVSIFKRTGTLERFARLRKGETLKRWLPKLRLPKLRLDRSAPRHSRPLPAAGQSAKKAKEAAASLQLPMLPMHRSQLLIVCRLSRRRNLYCARIIIKGNKLWKT